MKFLLYILFLLAPFCMFPQSASESLIVVHYDPAKKAELNQFIYRYNYVNNVYAGREKIMEVTGRKNEKDYIRADKGDNVLYKDRYLITGMGNILDLKEKKVLHDGSARLVRCSNDSIIFFTNDIFKGKFYSYFDLKANSYAEIKSLTFKPIVGQDVEFDRAKSPYKLYYYPQNKPKVLLMEDAGHGGVSATNSKMYDIPIYWIDNDNFLFPNIRITDLEGSIIKYTLSSKTAKPIGVFNSTAKVPPTYKIVRGPSGSFVEFYFKDKLFLINPVKETMLQSFYKEIDANFSIEVEEKSVGRGIWYKGKEIGKDHFDLKNIKTSANYAAIVKEIIMGDESYQQGMSVYNVYKGKWEAIDGEEVACLVGWIKL